MFDNQVCSEPSSLIMCSVAGSETLGDGTNELSTDDGNVQKVQMKRRSFSYEDKLQIINLLDTQSKGDVCKKFSLDESVLNKWIKQTSKIREMCLNDYSKNLKRRRFSDIKDVDCNLHAWFLRERVRGTPISGAVLKAQALHIAKDLGIKNFKASDNWLSGWKHRKNVRLLKPAASEYEDVLKYWIKSDEQPASAEAEYVLQLRPHWREDCAAYSSDSTADSSVQDPLDGAGQPPASCDLQNEGFLQHHQELQFRKDKFREKMNIRKEKLQFKRDKLRMEMNCKRDKIISDEKIKIMLIEKEERLAKYELELKYKKS